MSQSIRQQWKGPKTLQEANLKSGLQEGAGSLQWLLVVVFGEVKLSAFEEQRRIWNRWSQSQVTGAIHLRTLKVAIGGLNL
jgi:hypothetical protein